MEQVHSLANPFSASARGSKIPDSDSTKSVPISIVSRRSMASDAAGKIGVHIAPKLSECTSFGTTITGSVITTIGTAGPLPDYTALAAQFSSYRIVSWGVKVYSTLAPTNQSGYFTCITDPTFSSGFDTASSFFEETLTFPLSETSVQWVSKPVGNQYRDYIPIANQASWDHLFIYMDGMPASTSGAMQVEIYFNLECQVSLGSLSSAIATPSAEHKPHILAASAAVLKKVAGTKLGDAVKRGFMGWIRGALQRGGMVASRYLGIPSDSLNMIGDLV